MSFYYVIELNKKKVILQLIMITILIFFFMLKDISLAFYAVNGFVSAWLPGIFFYIFTRLLIKKKSNKFFYLIFAFAEFIKIITALALLLTALVLCKKNYLPLGITWLFTIIIQIILPILIIKISDKRKKKNVYNRKFFKKLYQTPFTTSSI